ncbi:MAG: type II toxin-antitoxin system YafQ family toxin [Candidatus Binataceae bacterium]
MARELIILQRFKRDYRNARKHAEFDAETLEYIFDALISGERLPSALREHRLGKRKDNWSGFTECHLGSDLLLIYRVRRRAVVLHRIGTHTQLFGAPRRRDHQPGRRPRRAK